MLSYSNYKYFYTILLLLRFLPQLLGVEIFMQLNNKINITVSTNIIQDKVF